MARRPVAARPARPAPTCETCGADVWQAWSVMGKCWIALAPRRYPFDGAYGTYEVWSDAHGGLLARYLEPGARGDQIGSWRGVHHNAACGTWRRDVTTALELEATAALAVMSESELLDLEARLNRVLDALTTQVRARLAAGRD